MAEDQTTPEAAASDGVIETKTPGVRVMAQYIRDLSFENPRAPDSLRPELPAPAMGLQIELNAKSRPDGFYEVDLRLIASATREGEAVFHVELVYGGVFAIDGVEPESMEPVLLVECPRYLFPFARQIIANVTTEGGFPPLRVDPIDFNTIYNQRRAAGQVQTTATQNA